MRPAVVGRGLALVLAALGAAAVAEAWRGIPVGSPDDPGPGALPVVVGVIVVALGIAVAFTRNWSPTPRLDLRRTLTVVAVVVSWVFAMPRLGFAMTSIVALFFLGRAIGQAPVARLLVFALLTGGGAVALFRGLLKLPLPRGPWGW
jgi:putative tricarboxylic transport membrane protein